MPISPYLRELRSRIGHDLVLLPAVSLLVRDDVGRLLLMRSAETGNWQTIGGMIDPDESPEVAAEREGAEETGAEVRVVGLRGAFGGPGYRVTYPNGDECSYVSIAYDAELVGPLGDGDDEVAELRWFALDEIAPLPLDPLNRRLLIDLGLIG